MTFVAIFIFWSLLAKLSSAMWSVLGTSLEVTVIDKHDFTTYLILIFVKYLVFSSFTTFFFPHYHSMSCWKSSNPDLELIYYIKYSGLCLFFSMCPWLVSIWHPKLRKPPGASGMWSMCSIASDTWGRKSKPRIQKNLNYLCCVWIVKLHSSIIPCFINQGIFRRELMKWADLF